MDEHTKVIALMAIALTDARSRIQVDRDSLYDSTVHPDGTIPDNEHGPIDELDRVLERIDSALASATGGRI